MTLLNKTLLPIIFVSLFVTGCKDKSKTVDAQDSLQAIKNSQKPAQAALPIAEEVENTDSEVQGDEAVNDFQIEGRDETMPVVALPNNYSDLMRDGRRLLNDKDVASVEYFTAASDIRPKANFAKIQLARALLLAERVDESQMILEDALETFSETSLGWNTLGRIHLMKKDGPSAIAAFQRAVEVDSENSYAWNNLGYTLLLRGEYQGAADALEEATSGHSVTPYMWNNLGLAYEHLDLIADARSAYRQAKTAGSEKAEASLLRLQGVVTLLTEVDDLEEDLDLGL